MKPLIVITRTQPDADLLAGRLQVLGYDTLVSPMLAARRTHMPTPHDPMCVEGLVVTSAHALRHLNALVREVALRHKPLYAVGPRTAQLAAEMGWTNVHDGGGDVRRLGDFLKSRGEITPSSRLLHICGREIARDTRTLLDQVPGRVLDWVVYETEPADGFDPETAAALAAGHVRAVLLHSARAARAFAANVQTYKGAPSDWQGIIFLCLSQAVLESLSTVDCGGTYAANTPDEDTLVALLQARVPTSRQGEKR